MALQILDQSNIPTIERPDPALCAALAAIGSASIASELGHMGVRQPHLQGITSHKKGVKICGPALTLQFMPKREDYHQEGEYQDPEIQLHRHVMYQVEKGDVVVVDARGDMASGVFGEMMSTYMAGRGGAGVVIDGCIRDSEKAMAVNMGFWLKGVTPNFHVQTNIMPWAVNVPVSCGGVLVVPGDLIVADDDGAVVIPISLAEKVREGAGHHVEWEDYSHLMLSQGGDLRKYYPLNAEAELEYQVWRKANPKT
ncbi:MAG: ribonuclease activity regulator RraA [Deltaproteobacteria bacterium]